MTNLNSADFNSTLEFGELRTCRTCGEVNQRVCFRNGGFNRGNQWLIAIAARSLGPNDPVQPTN